LPNTRHVAGANYIPNPIVKTSCTKRSASGP
jgi:hypothetical protein